MRVPLIARVAMAILILVCTMGATFTVTTKAGLQTAWAAQADGDVICLIAGKIEMGGAALNGISNDNRVALIGVTEDAEIDFGITATTTVNGLQFYGYDVYLKGLAVSGFHANGNLIKMNPWPEAASKLVAIDCTFSGGTIIHAPFTTPVTNSTHCVTNSAIASHTANSSILLINCDFSGFISSNRYSHGVYTTSNYNRIINCTFTDTGNPIWFTSPVSAEVVGCTFQPSRQVWDPNTLTYKQTYFIGVGNTPLLVVGCTFLGLWEYLGIDGGDAPAGNQTLSANDFSQCTFQIRWGLDGGLSAWPSGVSP